MKKQWFVLGLLSAIVLGFITYSCGTATQVSTTPTAGAGSVVSGTILVPASSVSSLGLRASALVKAQATADDGVSDTPLGGASVVACDPVTGLQITGSPTVTADSNGYFTMEATHLPASGDVLFKATKTVGTKSVIVKAMTTVTEEAKINAGTTLAAAKLSEELAKKAGDLLMNASSIPTDKKNELKSMMESMFSQIRNSIGTVASGNIPNLVVNMSGKTPAEIELAWTRQLTPEVNNEFVPPSGWDNNLSNFYNKATAAVTGATFPSGLQISNAYYPPDFTLPPLTFPSGVTFGNYNNNVSFFADVKDRISGISGAQFECKMPDYLTGYIPSGATITENASFWGSGWVAAGASALPANVYFSGFSGNLASYVPSGFTLPPQISFDASVVIPSSVKIANGFVMRDNMGFQSGYTVSVPMSYIGASNYVMSGVSFVSGGAISGDFKMGSGMVIDSGARIGSGVFIGNGAMINSGASFSGAYFSGAPSFASNFELPSTGVNFSGFIMPEDLASRTISSGYTISQGISFTSGYALPSGVSFQSGYIMPTNVSFQSGFIMPSNVSLQSGFTIPSGVSLQSGIYIPTGVSFQSGYEIPTGVSFQSGFIMPSNVSLQSGFVVPSGVSLQSGIYIPSGVSYQTGYSGYRPGEQYSGMH